MDGYFLFEEGVVFDRDDPDFEHGEQQCDSTPCRLHCDPTVCSIDQSTNMSCGVMQSETFNCHSTCSQWLKKDERREALDRRFESLWSSDCESDAPPESEHEDDPNSKELMTLEELRLQFHSCYTCGVSWSEDQVSLDCRECGGYASSRPCPKCDGRCEAEWHRNVETSHSMRKAQWDGECQLTKEGQSPIPQFSSHDLIQDLEALSTS